MIDLAIRALRQIEHSAGGGIWNAHRGCAALAGALLLTQDRVDVAATDGVLAAIRAQLIEDDVSAPNSHVEISLEEFVPTLAKALAVDAERPRELGHDVIYSAYVLRAMEVFQIVPWCGLLDAMIALIGAIKWAGPGWITINGENRIWEISSSDAAELECEPWFNFLHFERPVAMEVGDMQLGHLLTHGHAIEMLRPHVSENLKARLSLAWRRRIAALRAANYEEHDPAPLPRRRVDPRSREYWQLVKELGPMHGHALKYAYSFLDTAGSEIDGAALEAFGRIVWPGVHELRSP